MTVKLLMLVVFFAVWVSFLIGVGITVSNLFLHYIASPINAGAIAMVAGLIAVPPVSLITPKLPQGLTEGVFSCYYDLVEATTRKVLPEDKDFDSPAFRRKKK